MARSNIPSVEVPTSSMADIAFLLLTFFLITTEINSHKGLTIQLPPWQPTVEMKEIHARNLFAVQVNSKDQFLVEGEPAPDLKSLRSQVQEFIMNNGRVSISSDNPEVAVVSLKTDRGTSYRAFVKALDEIQGAYYEIYAQRAGISVADFRNLQLQDPSQRAIYDKARQGIPMNISIAEPTRVN